MKTMGDKGFHALKSPYSDFETSKVVIVPFCFAPDVVKSRISSNSIINASHEVSSFDEGLITAGSRAKGIINPDLEKELDRCEVLKLRGLATLEIIYPWRWRDSELCRIYTGTPLDIGFPDKIFKLLEAGKVPIILGGDHNITPLAIKGFKRKFDKLAVLHFDSRVDLFGDKDHRKIIDKIFPDVDLIVTAGYRSIGRKEMKFLKENGDKIHGIMMRDQLRPFGALRTAVQSIISYLKDYNVYITFDASFLDPSTIGHSVRTPEPGGMTYDETLDIWMKVLPYLNVVGADFVEFCVQEDRDRNMASTYAFAKLISRFISRLNLD